MYKFSVAIIWCVSNNLQLLYFKNHIDFLMLISSDHAKVYYIIKKYLAILVSKIKK